MSKHILFVLDYYTPHRGWSETVFENIISRLQKKKYTISILTSRFDPSLPTEEHHDAIHIYRTGKGRLAFVFSAFFRGRKILKKHKDISVIHASTYGGAIPASLLWSFFHKKVILTVHEIFGKLWYIYKWFLCGWLYRFFERLIFLLHYDIYHCVSRYTMNSLRLVYTVPDYKIRMIYNGVDTEFRNPKNVSESEVHQRRSEHGWDDRYVVLYYGHAGKSKGLDYLVQAMPEVMAQNKDILFVYNLIDSKRTNDTKLRIKNEELRIRKQWDTKTMKHWNVQIFNGFEQEKLRILVASADLVVAPSLSEWFWSVHTESVAMERPLLTTFIGPIPEVVRWNVKMIPPWSASEIADSVLDFAAGKIKENIPKKIFSRDETVVKIEELY